MPLQAIIRFRADRVSEVTVAITMAEVNSCYNVARAMIVKPFARPPAPFQGTLVDTNDRAWKMEAAEIGRLLRTLPFIVDALQGCDLSLCTLSLCRTVQLIRLISRENLPYAGWTAAEGGMLQEHIDEVWLPAVAKMLTLIHPAEKVFGVMAVFKTHMVVVHAVPRFSHIGGVQVISPLHQHTTMRVMQLRWLGFRNSPGSTLIVTTAL